MNYFSAQAGPICIYMLHVGPNINTIFASLLIYRVYLVNCVTFLCVENGDGFIKHAIKRKVK